MKKVSAIVLVYKSERYITETIRSVLEQTYENLEILIVDDGSPDRSIEICQQFTDPRIRIIRQENRGVAGARNTGIRHAQGEYLAFLDGDDLWLPEKIARHVEHLDRCPQVGVSFSRSAFIDENGNFLGTYQMPKLREITLSYMLRCNPIGNGSAAVFRREVAQAVKFPTHLSIADEKYDYFNETFRYSGGEIDFWLRVLIQTKWQIEGIPEALTLYRVNPGGISANLLNRLEYAGKEVENINSYAPQLNVQWKGAAKAYYLRYLARSAVRLRQGKTAVNLVSQALSDHWQILTEEPRHTLMTLIAAYLLWLLPQQFYSQIETVALKLVGASQNRRILQDKLRQLSHYKEQSQVNTAKILVKD